MKLENESNSDKGYHPFFIVMLILLFHSLFFFKYYDPIIHQITLRDFDGYWHLVRVQDLYHYGNINETLLSRSNAPYGESLHWTKAFDLMLYAGAYAGSFFMDFNVALLWWSIIINPLLHVLTFLALFWGLRDFFGDMRASIFGVLFPFQLFLDSIYDMGVPDHHGAIIFFFSLFIALCCKSIIRENWKIFSLCGIAGGLSIWLSIENIALILIAISVFGFIWILKGDTYKRYNFIFSFMVLLATLFTMLIDAGNNDFLKIEYDRRSIVHVFLWFTIMVFWILVALVSKWSTLLEKKIGRIIWATIGATACIFLMYEFFPLFFKNPLSEVNPIIKSIYFDQTNEVSGLFSGSHFHPKVNYVYWAMTLPAIPISIILARLNHSKERSVWIFITLINIFYIVFSALMFRMITLATLCALIPISYGLSHYFVLINNKLNRSYYRVVRTIFILTCAFSFLVPAMIFNDKQPDDLISDTKFMSQFCEYLNHDPYFVEKPRRVLTSFNIGPLLLYKTKHEVIGTPSHRNVSGILDTYHIMNARNESDAHMIINKRGIQVILIGRPAYGIYDFFIDINNVKNQDDIFHHQLWKGKIPVWLQLYPVPKYLEGKIKVFKVIR
jgi:hypothetical protein